jgi:sulfite reductase beta subunit-like hemoprotein
LTRDYGPRADRQKTRLIWVIEELGFEPFAALVAETMGPGTTFAPAVHVQVCKCMACLRQLMQLMKHRLYMHDRCRHGGEVQHWADGQNLFQMSM